MEEPKYYVYRHRRLDNNEIFYIGIGKEDGGKFLRSKVKRKSKRTNFWRNITNKTAYEIEIVATGLTREDACNKEKELISFYGRRDLREGVLVNLTDGGEMNTNIGPEVRAKISNSLKGRKLSEETKSKLREAVTKTWNSPEYTEQREVQKVRSKLNNELGIIGMKGKSSPKKGKPYSWDKEKIRQKLTQYYSSVENRNRAALISGQKKFNVYSFDHYITDPENNHKKIAIKGSLLFSMSNTSECAKQLNLERGHIRRCLKNELRQVKGYIFEYDNKD